MNVIQKEFYTEIQFPRTIDDTSNYNYFKNIFEKYHINYIIHQGRGHKLLCDISNILNIPTITFWCFWEEAIDINWKYGLINIQDNIQHHKCNENFNYIKDNIDYYYFASKFIKDTVENKHNIKITDDHIFPTLSNSDRFQKDNINSYNSTYITLLDAYTLKGGNLFAKLIEHNPSLNFLAIKTEDEHNGPEMIQKAIKKVSNKLNKILFKRVNNVKEVYNDTKILLCPTQLDETFCRVVYEAFYNKIPVIFSNKGNLGYINNDKLLKITEYKFELYNMEIQKLVNDEQYYNMIANEQYKYYLSIKEQSSLNIIENKLLEIENTKKKRIGIFTPWCDQGLGIQSRIYMDQNK